MLESQGVATGSPLLTALDVACDHPMDRLRRTNLPARQVLVDKGGAHPRTSRRHGLRGSRGGGAWLWAASGRHAASLSTLRSRCPSPRP